MPMPKLPPPPAAAAAANLMVNTEPLAGPETGELRYIKWGPSQGIIYEVLFVMLFETGLLDGYLKSKGLTGTVLSDNYLNYCLTALVTYITYLE